MKTWTLARPLARLCMLGLAAALMSIPSIRPAAALEKLTFLLPAPPSLPAFAPWVIAKQLGYYSAAGYDVEFITGRGGVDNAKQVGVGNVALGESLGDAPVIVRGNGVPIKDVAIIGGGGLGIVVARGDRGIKKFTDLRGKKIAVMSYQEGNYYALLGALAAHGIKKSDVNVEAVGPGGVVGLVVAGAVDACVCTPDWEVDVKRAVPNTVSMPLSQYFPTMAQSIVASDQAIASHPKMIRAFVQATLKAMKFVMDDPAKAAEVYAAAIPSFKGREELMREILENYVQRTYRGQEVPGAMDRDRLAKLQDFYLKQGIAKTKTPLDELYTNQFVK